MWRRSLILFLLASAAAWAQTPSPLGNFAQPTSAGAPHVCLAYYPRAALEQHREGATGLAFEVTAMGTVDAVTVIYSSGSPDLDMATMKCAARWLYNPAVINGTRTAVPWSAQVSWSLGAEHKLFAAPKPLGRISSCVKAYPSDTSHAAGLSSRITVVNYSLMKGVVIGAGVARSSGDRFLDQDAVACVMTWTFKPLYENGEPATGHQSAVIDWAQMTLS